MGIVIRVINKACQLYQLIVLIYCVLSWFRIGENKWTVLLKNLVEPALTPIRGFLNRVLPNSLQMIDFSPIVLMLLISVGQRILIGLLTF